MFISFHPRFLTCRMSIIFIFRLMVIQVLGRLCLLALGMMDVSWAWASNRRFAAGWKKKILSTFFLSNGALIGIPIDSAPSPPETVVFLSASFPLKRNENQKSGLFLAMPRKIVTKPRNNQNFEGRTSLSRTEKLSFSYFLWLGTHNKQP